MLSQNQWLREEDASKLLGVSTRTLQYWREVGYLKPGTHWRNSNRGFALPWNRKPNIIYHFDWCKEIIEYWRDKDAPILDMAA